MRVSSLPTITPPALPATGNAHLLKTKYIYQQLARIHIKDEAHSNSPLMKINLFLGEILTTPRRELAPPIEEDEEQDSERGAPLRQIENNISALLRGDIAVARVGGIHSESVIYFKRKTNIVLCMCRYCSATETGRWFSRRCS